MFRIDPEVRKINCVLKVMTYCSIVGIMNWGINDDETMTCDIRICKEKIEIGVGRFVHIHLYELFLVL